MNMITKIAFANMKHHKSKNILIGIAILLTTFLLFVIPTLGLDMILAQYAMVNEYYPTWHVVFNNLDENTVKQISVHHDVSEVGIRSDAGYVVLNDTYHAKNQVSLMYLDNNAVKMYKEELVDGKFPEKEDEIVVSNAILTMLGEKGQVGDTITIPYQILRNGELDYQETKTFVISGMVNGEYQDSNSFINYPAYVSEEFIKKELQGENIQYSLLLQIAGRENATTDDIEGTIHQMMEHFQISERNVRINDDYLNANYVDPATTQIIVVIMVIVMIAGIITIYSIYYVGMNQRVQEFGKLAAIGTTRHQLKQIVLREGMLVALISIPIGLLIGSILIKPVLMLLIRFSSEDNFAIVTIREMVDKKRIDLLHGWIYLLVIVVALLTVWISLQKPMKLASKMSIIDSMKYGGHHALKKNPRKSISVFHLVMNQITENRKRTMLTIMSMSVTGIFIMVIASVLSCTNPEKMTNERFNGQYSISPIIEEGNKEHPELAWTKVQQNNPLTKEFKEKIEKQNGVKSVDEISIIQVSGDIFEEGESACNICALPEQYAEELEQGIIEGSADYEDLKSGDKVIADQLLQYWYPDIQVGSKLHVTIHDGEKEYEKTLEVIAIGDYSTGLHNYNMLIMSKEAADILCSYNSNQYFVVNADKNFDDTLYEQLQDLVLSDGRLEMMTWQQMYDLNKNSLTFMNNACYCFFGILSIICIMNLINTMINSVHVRRKEFGMLQAIGMTDKQLRNMLLEEGLFYTVGTLLLTLGIGSILGYVAYLLAKDLSFFSIRTYTYPIKMAIIVSVVLILLQIFLSVILSRSVKKESLIDRIRFSE